MEQDKAMEVEMQADDVPGYARELDAVGFWRRLWREREWHGMDWWLIAISIVLLAAIVLMSIFAPLLAPYDPRESVGSSFIPPGGRVMGMQLVAQAGSDISGMTDLNMERVGVVRGTAGSEMARSVEGVRPRIERFNTAEEALGALEEGAVMAVILEPIQLGEDFAAVAELGEGTDDVFILGTDHLGRDVLSRIIWGAQIVLVIAFSSAIIALLLGVPLGLAAGFRGGAFDRVVSLLMDSLYSFPGLILAIAIAAMLGPGIVNITLAIAILYVPTYFRIVRGQVLSIKEELYVEAARSLGAKRWEIQFKYILPNVIPSIVVIFSVNVADAILTEAGLSFLGLGLPPDTPDWGLDLSRGPEFLPSGYWWVITFPGLMITLVSLGFSMLGEGLTEILNPRLDKS
jgi:peptide/nickel transport system permease protein